VGLGLRTAPDLTAFRSVMSLIRGVNSLFPCPRCLIHTDQQGDPSVRAPARTSADMQAIVQDARQERFAKDKEETLKSAGLRDVDVFVIFLFVRHPYLWYPRQNVFWKIANSDPYGALSFDRLHTFPGDIFRHHLWPRLQRLVESLGREASVMVNALCVSLIFRLRQYNSQLVKVPTVSHRGGNSPISKITSTRTSWTGPNGKTC
jgi:hypothetical protein